MDLSWICSPVMTSASCGILCRTFSSALQLHKRHRKTSDFPMNITSEGMRVALLTLHTTVHPCIQYQVPLQISKDITEVASCLSMAHSPSLFCWTSQHEWKHCSWWTKLQLSEDPWQQQVPEFLEQYVLLLYAHHRLKKKNKKIELKICHALLTTTGVNRVYPLLKQTICGLHQEGETAFFAWLP